RVRSEVRRRASRTQTFPSRAWEREQGAGMLDRLLSPLASVALALLVWLYARSRDPETLDSVPIPVQVSLPPGEAGRYLLEVTGPGYVPASFTGPPSRIRELRDLLR